MFSNSDDKLQGFVSGLIFGGIVASALTFLYTPKSGKKLRKDISRKTSDLSDDAQDKLQEIQRRSEQILSDTDKKIKQAVKEVENMMDDVKKKIK